MASLHCFSKGKMLTFNASISFIVSRFRPSGFASLCFMRYFGGSREKAETRGINTEDIYPYITCHFHNDITSRILSSIQVDPGSPATPIISRHGSQEFRLSTWDHGNHGKHGNA